MCNNEAVDCEVPELGLALRTDRSSTATTFTSIWEIECDVGHSFENFNSTFDYITCKANRLWTPIRECISMIKIFEVFLKNILKYKLGKLEILLKHT